MAPARGLSAPRALKVTKTSKSCLVAKYLFSHGCAPYFACEKLYTFPIVPAYSKPPRPLKRPQHFIIFFTSPNFYFSSLLFGAHLRNGYTSRAGAIAFLTWHGMNDTQASNSQAKRTARLMPAESASPDKTHAIADGKRHRCDRLDERQ